MSSKPGQEPELQWLEDAIVSLASAAFLMFKLVLSILFALAFAIWSGVTGSGRVNR